MPLLTMLAWKSKDGSHVDSLKKFAEAGGVKPPAGIKIKSSVHGVGRGFVLVEAESMEAVYSLCLEWAEAVTVEAIPVLDDDAAVRAVGRHHAIPKK